ncbi:MAG: hypothetical protein ACREIQ_05935 [Nitrospiria bacterium]
MDKLKSTVAGSLGNIQGNIQGLAVAAEISDPNAIQFLGPAQHVPRNLEKEIDSLSGRIKDLEQTLGETVKLTIFLWKAVGARVEFVSEADAMAQKGPERGN